MRERARRCCGGGGSEGCDCEQGKICYGGGCGRSYCRLHCRNHSDAEARLSVVACKVRGSGCSVAVEIAMGWIWRVNAVVDIEVGSRVVVGIGFFGECDVEVGRVSENKTMRAIFFGGGSCGCVSDGWSESAGLCGDRDHLRLLCGSGGGDGVCVSSSLCPSSLAEAPAQQT